VVDASNVWTLLNAKDVIEWLAFTLTGGATITTNRRPPQTPRKLGDLAPNATGLHRVASTNATAGSKYPREGSNL
jgi:hypothetical protein